MYDCICRKNILAKGGIIIPNYDFTTLMLNIKSSDIESSFISSDESTVYFNITLKRKPMTCHFCKGKMIGHGHKLKRIKHPAVREFNGVILYNANRYRCRECGRTALEDNPFALSGFNSSYLLIRSSMHYLRNLKYTLQMIADELNISSTQLNNYLDSYVTIPIRPLPESIGIDELHSTELSRQNSSYICIIVDNEKKCLYDVLDSRNKSNLINTFSRFSRNERLKVKFVTIDMWESYRDVATTYFPNCIVAVDPFHVIKHLESDFDDLRKSLMRSCEYGSNRYYLLKKWSWLLTRNNIEFDNERVFNRRFNMRLNRRDLRNMIFDSFPELEEAYFLKERYCQMNRECSYEEAVFEYDEVLDAFKRCSITQYDEFIHILIKWRDEILNSFKRPYENRRLSNALTENLNGKIREYLTISRGITNFSRFRKRVLFALSGDIEYAIRSSLEYEHKGFGRKRGPYNK